MAKRNNLLKDKKISIWKGGMIRDSLGQLKPGGYEKIHDGKLWAHYRQLSASESFEVAFYQYEADAVFTINWRDDIKNDMLILYHGEVYNIKKIDHYEDYKNDIQITAKTTGKDISSYKGMTDS